MRYLVWISFIVCSNALYADSDFFSCNTRNFINQIMKGDYVAFLYLQEEQRCQEFVIESAYRHYHLEAKAVLSVLYAINDAESPRKNPRMNCLTANFAIARYVMGIMTNLSEKTPKKELFDLLINKISHQFLARDQLTISSQNLLLWADYADSSRQK